MVTTPRPLRLSREQISRIVGNDPEAIRQFERLFAVGETAETTSPAIQAQIDALGLSPSSAPTDRQEIETIDWRRFPRFVSQEGRMGWEPVYATVGLGMGSNVLHRLGINSFVRVINNTGGTIAAGRVVASTAVSADGWPQVTQYLADGATPASAVLGVMAEDVATGAMGYACSYGPVMDLDTSAFSAGATVYASSTSAGGFTATQPAAPNIVLPIGTVTLVSSTQGVVLTRVHQMAIAELAAVTAPVGGVVVDTEARAAINAIIGRLQQAGIIA